MKNRYAIYLLLQLIFMTICFNKIALANININWREANSNAFPMGRAFHTSVVFNNKMWVIGGVSFNNGSYILNNDVWWSNDGTTWTLATAHAAFEPRDSHTSIVYDNKIWVIGGETYNTDLNDVWWSNDGITWTQATAYAGFAYRSGHVSIVYDNKMWIIGGQYALNDVWWSIDGINWMQAIAHAAFPGRSYHASIVYDNKMWVIGGTYEYLNHDIPNYKHLNDIWQSSDGITWTQAAANAAFSPRSNHSSIVFDNKMWMIGGSSNSCLNEVWWSINGTDWEQTISSNTFSPRCAHSNVIYNNKAWVIGGIGDTIDKDVWYSSLSLPSSGRPIIININPATYTSDTLLTGNAVYGDRNYTFIDPIPNDLLNQTYIKTLNNDKDATSFSLTFTVNQPVQIIMALDASITTPPQWMQGWTRRADMLATTDAVPARTLYEKKFGAGQISLGPNHDPNLFIGRSMYSVIILPIVNRARNWEFYQ